MPKIDGYEATKIIRQNEDTKSIPIIALTAHAVKSELKKYGDVFDDYLTKPIVKKILLETISRYI